MFQKVTDFVKSVMPEYGESVPLHSPSFFGNEKAYLLDCLESTYVSSVGEYVDRFEAIVAEYTGCARAVAVVNGTSALHVSLLLAGVRVDDEVLTQAATFVATANAIAYLGAQPVFLDSDPLTLGLCPDALEAFLRERCFRKDDGSTYDRETGRRVAACVPMHVFGHPVRIDRIAATCREYSLSLVEDAAESLGSYFQGRHTGTFGRLGILSFNGNKIITTGGGGMILTNDEDLADQAKHLTTTARLPHRWEYRHDRIGFNYRLPNINAALGCGQMERLPQILEKKRALASSYKEFFDSLGVPFVSEPEGCRSNYWLNAIMLADRRQRDEFLEYTNGRGVMTRPLWSLMPRLPMFAACQTDGYSTAAAIEDRLVNIPSSRSLYKAT